MVWPVSSDKWTAPLVWLYFKNIMKETTVELEVDDRLWTSNTSPVARLFQNKLMFLLKIMLIYDKPLLSGQPPLGGHLLVPRGWPLNEGSTVCLYEFWSY